MLGYEAIVGGPSLTYRLGEGPADRNLAAASVSHPSHGVSRVADSVPAIVHEPLRSAVAPDEEANPVRPSPAIGALPAGVRAVDAAAPGAMDVGDRAGTHGARMVSDHVTHEVELPIAAGRRAHAPIMTEGCDSSSAML